jgi:hypothetical protein
MPTPDPEEIARLRINLLRQLDAAAPASLRVSTLRAGALDEGFTADDHRILVETDHLADPGVGFISQDIRPLEAGVKRYKLTSKGRDFLRTAGY